MEVDDRRDPPDDSIRGPPWEFFSITLGYKPLGNLPPVDFPEAGDYPMHLAPPGPSPTGSQPSQPSSSSLPRTTPVPPMAYRDPDKDLNGQNIFPPAPSRERTPPRNQPPGPPGDPPMFIDQSDEQRARSRSRDDWQENSGRYRVHIPDYLQLQRIRRMTFRSHRIALDREMMPRLKQIGGGERDLVLEMIFWDTDEEEQDRRRRARSHSRDDHSYGPVREDRRRRERSPRGILLILPTGMIVLDLLLRDIENHSIIT